MTTRNYFQLSALASVFILAQLAAPNLRLVGLHQDTANKSFAIIEDQDTKRQDIFAKNMSVFNKATLTEINRDSITVAQENKSYTFTSVRSTAQQSNFSGETATFISTVELKSNYSDAIATKIAKLNDNIALIYFSQKQLARHATSSLQQAISDSKPIVESTPLGPNAVRLSNIANTNPLAKLGLKTGDTLARLNGRPINSLQDLYEIAITQPGERTPEISLVRNGQTIDLQFQMD